MHHPIEIFDDNWKKAKSLGDANAPFCSLATVSNTGQPSVRTLVLRGVTEDSFVIFIDETSPKWDHLKHSKQFELLVFWPSLMQQYRIRGELSELSFRTMESHWAKKPYDSKMLDHYYVEVQPQTSPVNSRETLLADIDALQKRYPADQDIPCPTSAKGISIKAAYIETWHSSDSDRLHKRHLYLLCEGQWERQVLVP
ncbi:MAG: pyridoxine/pyridoxamine 5'-phosphate oxidase [Alcanivorax sp.]|jgi:pyridoxine/pyridoxamine 5'-phosphate oxidase